MRIEAKAGDEGSAEDLAQIGFSQERGGHISQQHQREPAEDVLEGFVRAQNLQSRGCDSCRQHQQPVRNRNKQAQSGRHASDVGTGLNHVADERAGQNRKKKPARIMLANDGEEAFPCNLAHLRTEIHGGIHHGQERWDGPQERRPERGADRGVSSDRGGIVIGGPGNQPQAEGAKSPARHGF